MRLPESYPVDHGYFVDFFHLVESTESATKSDLPDHGSTILQLSPTLKQKSPGQIERRRLKQVKKRQAKRQNKRQENRQASVDHFAPTPADNLSPSESNPVAEDEDLELPLTSMLDVNFPVEGRPEVALKDLEVEMTDKHFPQSGSDIVRDLTMQLFITRFENLRVRISMMETMFTTLRLHLCPEAFSAIDQARNALSHQLKEYDIIYQKVLNPEEAHGSIEKRETDILYELDLLRKNL